MAARLTVTLLCFTLLFRVRADDLVERRLGFPYEPSIKPVGPSLANAYWSKPQMVGCNSKRPGVANFASQIMNVPMNAALWLLACLNTQIQFGTSAYSVTDCKYENLSGEIGVIERPASTCMPNWEEWKKVGCSSHGDAIYESQLMDAHERSNWFSMCANMPGIANGISFMFPDQLFSYTVTIIEDRASLEVFSECKVTLFQGVIGRVGIPDGCCKETRVCNPWSSNTRRQLLANQALQGSNHVSCCADDPQPSALQVTNLEMLRYLRINPDARLTGQFLNWLMSRDRYIWYLNDSLTVYHQLTYHIYEGADNSIICDPRQPDITPGFVWFDGEPSPVGDTATFLGSQIPLTLVYPHVQGLTSGATPRSARIQQAVEDNQNGGWVRILFLPDNENSSPRVSFTPRVNPERTFFLGISLAANNQFGMLTLYMANVDTNNREHFDLFGGMAGVSAGFNAAVASGTLFDGVTLNTEAGDRIVAIFPRYVLENFPLITFGQNEDTELWNSQNSEDAHDNEIAVMLYMQGNHAWLVVQVLDATGDLVIRSFIYRISTNSGLPLEFG